MRKIVLLVLCLSSFTRMVYSQNEDCSCKKDLIFLDEKIRKTPAYKINKELYKQTYSSISEKVDGINSLYDCHLLLNTLLRSLNDNHSRVYSINKGATDEIKNDSEAFAEFKNSEFFNTYPKPQINLDSLQTVLKTKANDEKEGVYAIENYLTLGVYKSKGKDHFNAIVLNSETDVWDKGEIIYTLLPIGNDLFIAIGGSPSSKRLIVFSERIEKGVFYYLGFKKGTQQTSYASETLSEDTYDRQELSDATTYLKIGSFNSWNPTLSEAEKFYKSLEGSLTKPNLIIDLRNNGGGGERNSDILFRLIKRYSKQNKVYVLINHKTLSNAERFAHELSQLDNCQLLGNRTNGSLAYEIKDSTYNLPCGKFLAVLTSKKKSKYLKFESLGIEPDVILNLETDWMEQLQIYISKNEKD